MLMFTKEFTDRLCHENPAGLQARRKVNGGVRAGCGIEIYIL